MKQFCVHFCTPENTCSPHITNKWHWSQLQCSHTVDVAALQFISCWQRWCFVPLSRAITINHGTEAIMFPNWWPMLTIANVFVCQPEIGFTAAPHWSIPYCQGKFYFLNKTRSGLEFITATIEIDQFATTEYILNCMPMASIWILKKINLLCIFQPPSTKQFFQLCLLNPIQSHTLSPLGCFPCAWWYCSGCWWCGYPGFWPGSMVCISSDCLLL